MVRLPKGSARRAAPIGALLSRVGQGLNQEEIGSPDGLGVVGKEGTPALAARPGWPAARVPANGACADGDAALKRGRPRERPDRQRQNRRQPWRCHRSTVSGGGRWRCGEDELEKFDHRGAGSPIDAPPRGGAQTFALLQPSLDFSIRNVLLASEVIGDDTTRSE